jgi:hypothetical protein
MDGDGRAGGGCGVGVLAGESLGESSELMSMLALYPALVHTREGALLLLPASARIQVVAKVIFGISANYWIYTVSSSLQLAAWDVGRRDASKERQDGSKQRV